MASARPAPAPRGLGMDAGRRHALVSSVNPPSHVQYRSPHLRYQQTLAMCRDMTAPHLAVKVGWKLAVTHGNSPQHADACVVTQSLASASLALTISAAGTAALGADTSKRGVAAFLAGNGGADYRALQALTWFYNWGDNVRMLRAKTLCRCSILVSGQGPASCSLLCRTMKMVLCARKTQEHSCYCLKALYC